MIHKFIYGLVKPKFVNLLGFKIYLNLEDRVLSETLVKNNIWEPFETSYFQDNIHKANVVLDIGANIGYYTLLFSRLVGKGGKVISFEPDKDNFSILSKNVSVNKCRNVILVNQAVADKSGNMNLYLDEMNKGDHHIYDTHDTRGSVPIRATTLDDYLQKDPYKIDYIKIDVQGAEGLVFEGMKKFLAKKHKVTIVCEYWPAGLASAGTSAKKFLTQLARQKFKIFQLDEETKTIRKSTIVKLIKTYTVKNKKYTNLLLIR